MFNICLIVFFWLFQVPFTSDQSKCLEHDYIYQQAKQILYNFNFNPDLVNKFACLMFIFYLQNGEKIHARNIKKLKIKTIKKYSPFSIAPIVCQDMK